MKTQYISERMLIISKALQNNWDLTCCSLQNKDVGKKRNLAYTRSGPSKNEFSCDLNSKSLESVMEFESL